MRYATGANESIPASVRRIAIGLELIGARARLAGGTYHDHELSATGVELERIVEQLRAVAGRLERLDRRGNESLAGRQT